MSKRNWKTPRKTRGDSSATGCVAGKPGAIPVEQDVLPKNPGRFQCNWMCCHKIWDDSSTTGCTAVKYVWIFYLIMATIKFYCINRDKNGFTLAHKKNSCNTTTSVVDLRVNTFKKLFSF